MVVVVVAGHDHSSPDWEESYDAVEEVRDSDDNTALSEVERDRCIGDGHDCCNCLRRRRRRRRRCDDRSGDSAVEESGCVGVVCERACESEIGAYLRRGIPSLLAWHLLRSVQHSKPSETDRPLRASEIWLKLTPEILYKIALSRILFTFH